MAGPLPLDLDPAEGANGSMAIRRFRREDVWHGGVPDVKRSRPSPADSGGGKCKTDEN
jgi:hypothetical protein